MIKISVGICTRNRPEELNKAIISVLQSTVPAYEIIVSDDSTDTRTEELLSNQFSNIIYIKGPRKGLCANRNNILKKTSGSHIIFIDDDVIMNTDFIYNIFLELSDSLKHYHDNVIVTGLEIRNGNQVYPHDQSFLGYQVRPYKDNETIKTVVINSTVFPISLFNEIQFDDQLIYGYDEVDLTTRAVKRGYVILLCEQAVNNHYPSPQNRDYYKPVVEASRIYVTYKRYLLTEKSIVKGNVFYLLASCHVVLSKLKSRGLVGLKDAIKILRTTRQYIRNMSQF